MTVTRDLSKQPLIPHGGEYGGRFLITPTSPVLGGVSFVEELDAEALVVDPVKYPTAYERSYQAVLRKVRTNRGIDRRRIPYAIGEEVWFSMAWNPLRAAETRAEVVRKSERYRTQVEIQRQRATEGRAVRRLPSAEQWFAGKVGLHNYMNDAVGDFRHLALTAVALAEMAASDGLIPSGARLHRGHERDGGTYAWATVPGPEGPVLIDPAEEIFMPLAQALEDGLAAYEPLDLVHAPAVRLVGPSEDTIRRPPSFSWGD